MMNFPTATRIHRRMPKEAFYKRLTLTAALKERFVSDVDCFYIENSLTMDNLRLTKESEVKEVLLLTVSLKKKEFDGNVIEAIARQNPHKLVFLLCYENQRQLALYYGKLYRTAWVPEEQLSLEVRGFSLTEVWEGFVEQVALVEERVTAHEGLTMTQRLALQEKILKLEKQIQKTEASMWKEIQPKKRFALHQKLMQLKRELDEYRR